MNVFCGEHGPRLCTVDRAASTGKVRLHYASAPWREKYARDHGHDNVTWNLTDWSRPTIEAGGCRACGVHELSVADLLQAFEKGRRNIKR